MNKISKIMQQIRIASPISDYYQSTVTLAQLENGEYAVLIVTTHMEVNREYVLNFADYSLALDDYLARVAEYATHTAILCFAR